MILIKDTEPSEDMKPVRISASRGRGAETYLRDRCPEYGGGNVRVCAMVNRDVENVGFRGPHGERPFHQVIELGSSQATNTITSVQKDNLVWIEREL